MQITGIKLALLDIPAELTDEYNRWYDLDHLPEHVSKGDVVAGRRYVADRELREAPGIKTDELTDGHPPYATIYSFGGPVDFAKRRGPRLLAGQGLRHHPLRSVLEGGIQPLRRGLASRPGPGATDLSDL